MKYVFLFFASFTGLFVYHNYKPVESIDEVIIVFLFLLIIVLGIWVSEKEDK